MRERIPRIYAWGERQAAGYCQPVDRAVVLVAHLEAEVGRAVPGWNALQAFVFH